MPEAAATEDDWGDTEAVMTTESFQRAQVAAEKFTRRVRPSSLAQHGVKVVERSEPDWFAPPEYPEEQRPPGGTVDYGNWWHGMMETTPWAAGPAAWAGHWEQGTPAAPEPERARAESARLAASPLALRLAVPGLEFATELPFLWAEPDGAQAFDGCMDLAVWDAAAGRWLVVDWKTDRVEHDAAAELRERYGAQLAVYARALEAVYQAPVEAYIYSTRAGELIRVSGDE
jgi:ATP-dependent exoDNAse (exonuclease V) beta subunit